LAASPSLLLRRAGVRRLEHAGHPIRDLLRPFGIGGGEPDVDDVGALARPYQQPPGETADGLLAADDVPRPVLVARRGGRAAPGPRGGPRRRPPARRPRPPPGPPGRPRARGAQRPGARRRWRATRPATSTRGRRRRQTLPPLPRRTTAGAAARRRTTRAGPEAAPSRSDARSHLLP